MDLEELYEHLINLAHINKYGYDPLEVFDIISPNLIKSGHDKYHKRIHQMLYFRQDDHGFNIEAPGYCSICNSVR